MREHFLLDTGLLLDFFVLQYMAEASREWPDTTFEFQALRTQVDREDFQKFVRANRGHLGTSSGVVTEVHRFLQRAERGCEWRLRNDLRQRFWRLVRTTFRDLELTERAVPLIEVAEEVLIAHGPVDAGLFELARRSIRHQVVVLLTADSELLELCKRHELQAEYVQDRLRKFRETV